MQPTKKVTNKMDYASEKQGYALGMLFEDESIWLDNEDYVKFVRDVHFVASPLLRVGL